MAPRPAARPTGERTPTPPARPVVRDFSTTRTEAQIEWDVRPIYDFLFSLSEDAGSTDDLPEDDRRWLADARASLPEADRASVTRLLAHELCIFVASFAVDGPRDGVQAPDVATFIDQVEAADPIDLLRSLLADILRDPASRLLFDRLRDGDATAAAEILERVPEHKDKVRDLVDDPVAGQAQLVSLLRAWAVRFAEVEERVRGIIERDFALRAADREALPGTDLIERVTGGIRWLPEAGVTRAVLAPAYFIRPYNFILSGDDWRLFAYPVSDAAVQGDPLAPSPALLRLHRALGDATRLRILKLLAANDLYLTEIAVHLDLSKPTIKHHLAQLRAAGLVTVVEEGAMTYYSLRRQRLDDASVELKAFLVD